MRDVSLLANGRELELPWCRLKVGATPEPRAIPRVAGSWGARQCMGLAQRVSLVMLFDSQVGAVVAACVGKVLELPAESTLRAEFVYRQCFPFGCPHNPR